MFTVVYIFNGKIISKVATDILNFSSITNHQEGLEQVLRDNRTKYKDKIGWQGQCT